MDKQIDISYLKGVYRRQKLIIWGAFSFIFLVTMCLVIFLPPLYRSQVGIIIEEQQIPKNYVKSTITSFVEERIEMITQQVMSRSKLLEIPHPNGRSDFQ